MTLPEYLCSLWRASNAFTTLAGNRVYPSSAPDDVTGPFLVFTIIAGELFGTHDDAAVAPSTDLQRTTVQLAAYARKRSDASALARVAHDVLQAAQGAELRVNLDAGPRDTKEGELYRSDRDVAIFHAFPV